MRCLLSLVFLALAYAQDQEITCTKQPYKETCANGRKAQFTLRWYVKDGKCCSYPWGHCKRDEIAKETVMRTKAECEMKCLGMGPGSVPGGPSGPGGQRGPGGPGGPGGSSGPLNSGSGPTNSGTGGGQAPSPFNGDPCAKQNFRRVCGNGRQTQFTLRWYLKDGKCCSYPWGHCKRDEIAKERVLRTKADCEAVCVRGEPIDGGGAGATGTAPGGGGAGTVAGTSPNRGGGSTGTATGTGGAGGTREQTGGQTGGSPGSAVTPSCEKVPFRETCENGRKSQFALRWYVKDGKCCSYPWGHCKRDEIAKESSIRTKKACEEICLGGGRK